MLITLLRSSTMTITVLLIVLSTSQAADSDDAMRAIQTFYKAYLDYHRADLPHRAAPAPRLTAAFAHEIEINQQNCARYSSEVCGFGADGDPYLNAQEIDPKLSYGNSRIQFKAAAENIVQVSLNVYPSLQESGKYYDVTINYKLIRHDGEWLIDDLFYDDGISMRQKMAEENAYVIANPSK